MKTKFGLYNTSHPLAANGKPIFIPLGEWDYDGKTRQRLDKAHAQAIANTLNARIAKGEPGIPVYQGHPDVPEIASKYPDKGALGWVVKAGLANEGGKDGLALTVDWDRDPGKGFKWFSPYWLANERDGNCLIVAEIVSIGLVNNPNIPEFRLANELQGNVNDNATGANAGEGKKNMDRAKLIQALGLPETATDEDIIAAIEKCKAAASDAATKQAAAEAEKGQAEKERDEAKTALANERAAHCGLLLDQAIAEGRISVAGRAAWEKRLADDFAAGRAALANEKPLKTQSAVSATPGNQAQVDLVALANERMSKNPTLTYSAAFAAVMKEHPEVK